MTAGQLGLSSTGSALQTLLRVPQTRLRYYGDVLAAAPDVPTASLTLLVAAETKRAISAEKPLVEVAWTYPGGGRPGVRTTGGVAREIIAACNQTLLVVGFSVAVTADLSGIAAQTLRAIALAAERGIVVTAVLHRKASLRAFLKPWRQGVPPPSVFTWPESGDEMASVHAKLLVADRKDALVTSANLTYHGFEGNLEMGLRVTGEAAAEIHDRVHELIAKGDLVPW